MSDRLKARGVFTVECLDADGGVLWRERFDNTVVVVGKNLLLSSLAGSTTLVGPFMGLISSTSFSAISSSDTMASHPGWLEAGSANTPPYTAPRPTAVFATPASGAVSLTSSLAFAITGSGTIEGCFIVFGSGAVATIGSTTGTLLSAGLFSGGAQTVSNGNTVNVSYSLSI